MTGKKKKATIISISVVAGFLVFVLIMLIVSGSVWGWGPFKKLVNNRYKKLEGNSPQYSLAAVEQIPNSPLEGKNILYLGSSVTEGAASLQVSFVEYIAKRNNTTYVKNAVGGTTLVDEGLKSYISRLKKIDKNQKFDLFVCQLSTNDSWSKKLGSVTDTNTKTICGAINYVIDYVNSVWGCPIVFYTNAYFEGGQYAEMVNSLKEISKLKNIGVIDLYTDSDFNAITDEQRKLFMKDDIHPTQAGYLLWWTPKMEQYLYQYFK